eukprot:gene26187-32723_t
MDQLLDMTKAAFADFAGTTEAAINAARPQVLAVDEDAADAAALQLDTALLRAVPVVVAPAHCAFLPLQENGHRLVLATEGVYLEARRPWLHLLHRLTAIPNVHVPYGGVQAKVELAFGPLGGAMPQLQEFARHARDAAPVEAAASVIWNSAGNAWRIAYPETIGEASAAHIQFNQVELAEDEHLVIDLHSHGHGPAFFSATDDADDAGSVKIAGVYGKLDQDEPTVTFRLCVLGLTIPLNVPAARIFA